MARRTVSFNQHYARRRPERTSAGAVKEERRGTIPVFNKHFLHYGMVSRSRKNSLSLAELPTRRTGHTLLANIPEIPAGGTRSEKAMKPFYRSLLIVVPALAAALAVAQQGEKPAAPSSQPPLEQGFVSIFDGQSLKGWHISAKSGHSGTSKHQSGGRWVVENGAITGSQDVPGNGGLVVSDEAYGDFEVALEMNNDFGPDSGLFLRSTEDGKAWQAMIDYHSGGNLMGIYGEGLGGNPHVRNYNFKQKVTEIDDKKTGEPPTPLAVHPASWPYFWRHGQWNELRARITGNPPFITTWINGVKIMEWQEKTVRHPEKGAIALQVHGGGDHTKEFVRYRNIRVKKL